MDFMECFMENDHPFKDVAVRHESGLGVLHHRMRNLCEPISPDLGEDLKLTLRRQIGLNCSILTASVFFGSSVIVPKFK